jgi:hypothetical protein
VEKGVPSVTKDAQIGGRRPIMKNYKLNGRLLGKRRAFDLGETKFDCGRTVRHLPVDWRNRNGDEDR